MRNGRLYRNLLKAVPGVILQEDQLGATNVFWMNGIVIDPVVYGHSREELIAHLRLHGVDTRLFFNGLHRQASLNKFGCACDEGIR